MTDREVLFLLSIQLSSLGFQGVLRDEEDLGLFDDQFRDAYKSRRVDLYDEDDSDQNY